MSHKVSKKIKFTTISKEKFFKLLDQIKKIDKLRGWKSYEEEGADGFLDLYNYWDELGLRRFDAKVERNEEVIKELG